MDIRKEETTRFLELEKAQKGQSAEAGDMSVPQRLLMLAKQIVSEE
jgi:hypothetical protein